MTDFKRNGYDDEDALQLIQRIEELKAKKASIMAAARGECAGVQKQIKNAMAEAKDINLPAASLRTILRRRELEWQIDNLGEGVPEDEAEIYEDMAGQFCMFAPIEDEATDDADGEAADEPPAFDNDAEQAAGAEALSQVKH